MLATRPYPGVTKWILLTLAFTIGLLVILKETAQRLMPQVQPDHEKVHPLPPIYPKPATPTKDDEVITFFHLTTTTSAQSILEYGLQPTVGARSGNDARFFAITQQRGPYPRPTRQQITEMLEELAQQLIDSGFKSDSVVVVYIKIPLSKVETLETANLIRYGPFFPASASGYTETIFEVLSFPIVNQFKDQWYSQPLIINK